MKGLKKFIDDKLKPPFKEGGKLHKYWPVIDALDTFAFVPGHVTQKGAHIRDGIDLKRTMFMVILAMIPCLLFGIYNVGYQHYLSMGTLASASFTDLVGYGMLKVLPIVIVSYGVGLGIEFIFTVIRSHPINEGFLVSGMLIPLIMPVEVPLWMVAVATAFAVIIGKEVFGGTGMNILNVALTARAFLFFAYPTKMSGNKVWVGNGEGATVDTFTGETLLAQATTVPVEQFTDVAGNAYASVQQSFMDSFIGFIPGSIGETSVIACLLGAALLIFTGIGSWKIMLSSLLGGIVMGLIFNWLGPIYFPDNSFLALPWWYHLAIGGFIFGIVFMATDPVTAAQTDTGKWIYGFLIGILAILIRTVNPAYPEGVMMAILFMNVMAPMIDHYVIESNIKRRAKRLKVKTA